MNYPWPCFVCRSLNVCQHREPELVDWWTAGGADKYLASEVETGVHAIGTRSEVVSAQRRFNWGAVADRQRVK